MRTYEQMKAPSDAPVTWRNVGCSVHGTVYELNNTVHWSMFSSEESANEACRAFHLAKLAEEMGAWLFDTGKEAWCADWLRRYRAAKGEA